jgi:hypothetical protein
MREPLVERRELARFASLPGGLMRLTRYFRLTECGLGQLPLGITLQLTDC